MLGRRMTAKARKATWGILSLAILLSLQAPSAARAAGAPLTLDEAARISLGEGPQAVDLRLSADRAAAGAQASDAAFHWRVSVGTARIPQLVELADQFGTALGDVQTKLRTHLLGGPQGPESEPGSPGATGVTGDPTASTRWAILPAISATRTLPTGGQLTLSTHWSAYGPVGSDSTQEEPEVEWQPFAKAPLVQFAQPLGRPLFTLEPFMRKDEAARNIARDAATASLTRTKTLLDLSQAYFAAAQARDEVAVAARAVASAETEARIRHDKAAHNDATVPDLLETDLLVARANGRLEAARHAQVVADQRLNRLLGRPLTDGVELTPPTTAPSAPSTRDLDLPAAIAQALASRQEIALALTGVDSAKAQLAATQQNAGLQVSGTASAAKDGTWIIGMDAQWPLFDAGLGESQVKQAAATLSLAEKGVQDRRDEVSIQVTQAYYGRLDAARAYEVADRAAARAREVAGLTRARYEQGATIEREVAVTRDALAEAEVARRAALYRWYQAEWAWLAALGSLEGGAVSAVR